MSAHATDGLWVQCKPSPWFVLDSRGEIVASTDVRTRDGGECKANAEFIVRACNLHPEMVSALLRAEEQFGIMSDMLESSKMEEVYDRALEGQQQVRAILTKVGL